MFFRTAVRAVRCVSEVGVLDAGQLHEVSLQAPLERLVPVHRDGEAED